MFNFHFDMTPTYKLEYEWGMINQDTLRSFVETGALSKEGYKEILGVDYDAQDTGVSQPQA